ncbi:MASE3 domain-containing protein [Arcticibacter tournemirensis]|uniref:histidine kinase n=1 Tax=Arcticibacter tournemirensis TaxID=699437 RepID=A0A4Q0MBH7_9SPHI|nr:MASE3 domain-containing protein [Arcticibacter tournemirensis]RXF70668.1 PAS domain S-box protein [Arcticibacter tournemirensis]
MSSKILGHISENYRLAFGIVVLALIFILSLDQSYLLFHTIVELLSIIVAFAVFIVTWNSRKILDNNYLFLVGISYFFIGTLDLLHTITFNGMQVIKGDGFYANQFWVATRFLESVTLLLGFWFLSWRKKLSADLIFLLYFAITAVIILSILYWKVFPVCFVAGQGQTDFKIYSEYAIIFLLTASIGMLIKRRRHFSDSIYKFLFLSITFTIISEFCFTLYISNYSLSNEMGHYAKLISFYLIYRANVQTGFMQPTDIIFKNLKDSEEQYRTLTENIPEVIMRFDSKLNCIYSNGSAKRFFPVTHTGTGRIRYTDLGLPPSVEQLLSDALENTDRTGELHEVDFNLKAGGEDYFFSMEVVPEYSNETGLKTYLMICFDITTLKHAEKELRELNATKDKFFSIIAHDLKNPFTSLLGFSQLLSKNASKLSSDRIQQLAERMNESARQTYNLLENLLSWARIQTGNLSPVKQVIDVPDLLTEAIRVCSPGAMSKGIEINAEYAGDERIIADRQMVNAVLRNIIINAIKFSYPGGEIILNVDYKENMYQFSVADAGVGIEEEHAGKVLTMDNNISRTGTANETGTGLGLILCKEFIEINGGRIWFESSAGQGTTFYFTLPVANG